MSSDPKLPLSFSGEPFKSTENETIFCDRQVHEGNDSSEAGNGASSEDCITPLSHAAL